VVGKKFGERFGTSCAIASAASSIIFIVIDYDSSCHSFHAAHSDSVLCNRYTNTTNIRIRNAISQSSRSKVIRFVIFLVRTFLSGPGIALDAQDEGRHISRTAISSTANGIFSCVVRTNAKDHS